jgi:hypothetical protein
MATNAEIMKKHSTNPNAAVEQMDCSLDNLMDEARADEREKIEKPIIENAIEEIYRELHNGIKTKKYSVNELAFATRILERIRRMCLLQFAKSPKGYLTKTERENEARADTTKQIFSEIDKLMKIELLRRWGKGEKMKQHGVIWVTEYQNVKKKYEVD